MLVRLIAVEWLTLYSCGLNTSIQIVNRPYKTSGANWGGEECNELAPELAGAWPVPAYIRGRIGGVDGYGASAAHADVMAWETLPYYWPFVVGSTDQ